MNGWMQSWRVGIALIPAYVQGGRLLDVGCGNGTMLRLLGSLGWSDLHGIELDPEAARRARGGGAEVRCGTVEEVLTEYPDNHFDAVIAGMVVEHLTNPYSVVRQIARKMRPNGELLLSTISRDSADAAFFGRYWAGFDFPRHMVYFRRKDITAMLDADFGRIEWFPQVAPVDWIRSASWRHSPLDRVLTALGTRGLLIPIAALALLGSSTRLSLRCRRKVELAG